MRGYLFEQGTKKGRKLQKKNISFLESFWSQSEHRGPSKKNDFLDCPQNDPKAAFWRPRALKVAKREHWGGPFDTFFTKNMNKEKCVWTAQACTDSI